MTIRRAKLFTNGGSQAVRLPAEFRFDGDEVLVRRDPISGDVVLSSTRASTGWATFFAARDQQPVDRDFMDERPGNEPLDLADPFG